MFALGQDVSFLISLLFLVNVQCFISLFYELLFWFRFLLFKKKGNDNKPEKSAEMAVKRGISVWRQKEGGQ